MHYLIDLFWEWLGKSSERYAAEGIEYVNDHMEFDFPRFDEIISYAKEIVDKQSTSDTEIDELITIMAIDNESERILEYIEHNSSIAQLDRIIILGVNHLQPEARWQIAELILRVNSPKYISSLIRLSDDSHPYVKKRAKSALVMLGQ